MKTIKKLEKEIEELDTQHSIHTGIKVEECSDNNCIDKPKLILLKAKLQTLKDVLELVGELTCDKHDWDNPYVYVKELRQKIMGVNPINEVKKK